MRPQHKFVITAVLVCHLFLLAPLVTSQAHPPQPADAPVPEQTPTPTPAEPSAPPAAGQETTQPAQRTGNCHTVITAPPSQKPGPSIPTAKPAGKGKQPAAKKTNLPISAEAPIVIDADECEKAGNVYTLRGNIAVHFDEYEFHADTATYDAATAELTAKGNASLDGGRRDLHLSANEAFHNTRTHTG